MKFKFTVQGHDLTEREIIAYEAGARVKLPPQYREFLLEQNGCLPTNMIHLDTGFDADVSEILPLFLLGKSSKTSVAKCENGLIWFAIDSGGGEFGVAYEGRDFGKVFWFDTPHSDLQVITPRDCTLVAPSFNAFIESLILLN